MALTIDALVAAHQKLEVALRENQNLKRLLWTVVDMQGGELVIPRVPLESWRPDKMELVATPSSMDGSLKLIAVKGE